MGIFKAYDVRGTYPDQINEKEFYKIGMAAVAALQVKHVVVGHDMRLSSESLYDALISGAAAAGADVTAIGMASTPMVYFATAHCKAEAGIQITASHNPAQYNGAKFCRAEAVPVAYGTGLELIEQKYLQAGDLTPSAQAGEVKNVDIHKEYVSQLAKYAGNVRPLTVVVDAGNGVMGKFLPKLFEKLPCELIPLYFEPDGSFPNHEANPLEPKNMRDLIAKVKETGADLGVAFDGDGDRSMYVDETGEIVPCDAVTALLARDFLQHTPGATIVYDLRSSRMTPEEITRLGGKPLISRVGHSFIKKLMRDTGAVFAGELSGHFYFKELHYTDNAEMAMLALLSVIGAEQKKLSEIVAPLRRYAATGEINFTVSDTAAKIKEIKEHYAGVAGAEILEIDGLSVNFADWWFNLRPSNTEPVLRLNLEGCTAELRDAKKAEVEALICG